MPLSKAGIQPTNFCKVASAIYPWAYLKPHILAHPDTVLSTSVMVLMSGTGPVVDINVHTLEKWIIKKFPILEICKIKLKF